MHENCVEKKRRLSLILHDFTDFAARRESTKELPHTRCAGEKSELASHKHTGLIPMAERIAVAHALGRLAVWLWLGSLVRWFPLMSFEPLHLTLQVIDFSVETLDLSVARCQKIGVSHGSVFRPAIQFFSERYDWTIRQCSCLVLH